MESKPITNGRFVRAEEGDTFSQPTKSLSTGIVESKIPKLYWTVKRVIRMFDIF